MGFFKRIGHFVHDYRLAIVSLLLLTFAGIVYTLYYYDAPGPLTDAETVIFKRGDGFIEIVDRMQQEGVIQRSWLFKAIAVGLGDARKFKAGEYHFSAAISPRLVMDMIAEGRVVVHKVTIPEGLTVPEIAQILKNEKVLEGEVLDSVTEGTLLPETYHFVYGDKRQDLITRMQAGMTSLMNEVWEKRKPGLPLETPEQALTLASIVEKETRVPSERGRVAAVFINRLRKKMKLQSDPTVAYGMELEKGAKNKKPLTTTNLRTPTSFNTYVIDGLPPGPIGNPGRAAIEATLNPPETNELYFVATGTGGHNFSTTLDQHNEYVRKYRALLKSQPPAPAKPKSPPITPPAAPATR